MSMTADRLNLGGLAVVSPDSVAATCDLASAVLQAAQAWDSVEGPRGWVYLLHFERPYRHARHYTGFATDLERRLNAHLCGRGARLMAVIAAAGIGWQLARVWPGTRGLERCLKNQGGAARRCPICSAVRLAKAGGAA
jgi:hypothetical protein